MGRPCAPHNRRFLAIPPKFERGTVYAAELENGMVKVGYSRCPRYRMVLLSHETKRDFGADIVRFHIGPDLKDRRPFNVETDLIRLAAEFGQALPGRREYFERLHFDIAVALIKGLCATVTDRR